MDIEGSFSVTLASRPVLAAGCECPTHSQSGNLSFASVLVDRSGTLGRWPPPSVYLPAKVVHCLFLSPMSGVGFSVWHISLGSSVSG